MPKSSWLQDLERKTGERALLLRKTDPLPEEVTAHLRWSLGHVPDNVYAWAKDQVHRNGAWCAVKLLVPDFGGAGIRKRHTRNYWVWYAKYEVPV